MHLDSLHVIVQSNLMRKAVHQKLSTQFAIDSSQQIAIESRGYTQGFVIGSQQGFPGLAQVRTKQQEISRP